MPFRIEIIKISFSLHVRQAYLRQNSLEWQSQRGTYCERAEGPLKGPESFMPGQETATRKTNR
jgi:hypothetical protein